MAIRYLFTGEAIRAGAMVTLDEATGMVINANSHHGAQAPGEPSAPELVAEARRLLNLVEEHAPARCPVINAATSERCLFADQEHIDRIPHIYGSTTVPAWDEALKAHQKHNRAKVGDAPSNAAQEDLNTALRAIDSACTHLDAEEYQAAFDTLDDLRESL